MVRRILSFFLFFIILISSSQQVSATYTKLHDFTGTSGDGSNPADFQSLMTVSNNVIYGATNSGGGDDRGTIYKVNTDGSGYTILHSFSSSGSDGRHPEGGILVIGSTLYGTTSYGGVNDQGTIYKINTDGSGYAVLYNFSAVGNSGANPGDTLVNSGSVLYGMTGWYGANDGGTIYKINTDGTGFTVLHEFYTADDALAYPYWGNSLTISGSTLYGATYYGGFDNSGTVFKLNTDGTGYTVIHEFDRATDGRRG